MFQSEHAVFLGDGFDFAGVGLGDVATEEVGDFFADDELFHDDGAARVAEGVFPSGDGAEEANAVGVKAVDAR